MLNHPKMRVNISSGSINETFVQTGLDGFVSHVGAYCRHDLAVVDFRIALEESVKELSSISIERWLPESAFRSDMDVVAYTIKDRGWKSET